MQPGLRCLTFVSTNSVEHMDVVQPKIWSNIVEAIKTHLAVEYCRGDGRNVVENIVET